MHDRQPVRRVRRPRAALRRGEPLRERRRAERAAQRRRARLERLGGRPPRPSAAAPPRAERSHASSSSARRPRRAGSSSQPRTSSAAPRVRRRRRAPRGSAAPRASRPSAPPRPSAKALSRPRRGETASTCSHRRRRPTSGSSSFAAAVASAAHVAHELVGLRRRRRPLVQRGSGSAHAPAASACARRSHSSSGSRGAVERPPRAAAPSRATRARSMRGMNVPPSKSPPRCSASARARASVARRAPVAAPGCARHRPRRRRTARRAVELGGSRLTSDGRFSGFSPRKARRRPRSRLQLARERRGSRDPTSNPHGSAGPGTRAGGRRPVGSWIVVGPQGLKPTLTDSHGHTSDSHRIARPRSMRPASRHRPRGRSPRARRRPSPRRRRRSSAGCTRRSRPRSRRTGSRGATGGRRRCARTPGARSRWCPATRGCCESRATTQTRHQPAWWRAWRSSAESGANASALRRARRRWRRRAANGLPVGVAARRREVDVLPPRARAAEAARGGLHLGVAPRPRISEADRARLAEVGAGAPIVGGAERAAEDLAVRRDAAVERPPQRAEQPRAQALDVLPFVDGPERARVAAHRVARRALRWLARPAEQLVGAAAHLCQRPSLVEAAALVLEGLEDAHEVGVDGARLRVKPRRRVAGEGDVVLEHPRLPPPAAPRPCAGGGAPPPQHDRWLVHQKREQHRVRADGGRKVEARRRRAAPARPREAEQRVEPHGDALRPGRPQRCAATRWRRRVPKPSSRSCQRAAVPARRHRERCTPGRRRRVIADPDALHASPAQMVVSTRSVTSRGAAAPSAAPAPHQVCLRDPHRRRADDDVEGPAAPLAGTGSQARRAARGMAGVSRHGPRTSTRYMDAGFSHRISIASIGSSWRKWRASQSTAAVDR